MVTTSSNIKHELKGSVDAMKIIEEHGQRGVKHWPVRAIAVDTINKRVGRPRTLLHAAKVSSDAQNMNFDQLKKGQDSLERGQATLYETTNDRLTSSRKPLQRTTKKQQRQKLWEIRSIMLPA